MWTFQMNRNILLYTISTISWISYVLCNHGIGLQTTVGPSGGGPTVLTGIRLSGGSSTEGRIEIEYSGSWGTVCDDNFDNNDATVFCRMLGFNSGEFLSNDYGGGSGTIWLDEVGCLGYESIIDDCSYNQWGTNDCSHSEDTSIRCSESASGGITNWNTTLVHLADGSTREGRLELYYQGAWGTVCDDNFGDDEATVFCRMLGYTKGYFLNNRYGEGSGDILLDDVDCSGYETDIDFCSHGGWYGHNCGHSEDVSIRCGGDFDTDGNEASSIWMHEVDTRLVGTPAVLYQGSYGRICDDGFFDHTAADIMCKELGWDWGEYYEYGGTAEGLMWWRQVECSGDESTIFECDFLIFNVNITWSQSYSECPRSISIECKTNEQKWLYPVIGVGAALGFFIIVGVICCTCKANKSPRARSNNVSAANATSTRNQNQPSTAQQQTNGAQKYNYPANGYLTQTNPNQLTGGYSTQPSGGYSASSVGYSRQAGLTGPILGMPSHPPHGHLPPLGPSVHPSAPPQQQVLMPQGQQPPLPPPPPQGSPSYVEPPPDLGNLPPPPSYDQLYGDKLQRSLTPIE